MGQVERVVNLTGLSDAVIERAVAGISDSVASWSGGAYSQGGMQARSPLSMFTRGSFLQPRTRQEQLWAAQTATRDTVISSALETLEGVALDDMEFECADETTEDLLNQVLEDVDLPTVMRRMYRELATYGLFTAANWWTSGAKQVEYTAKNGQTRSKTIQATTPERIAILDVCKVIPMSTGPWGTKRLLWQHVDEYTDVPDDESSRRLFTGVYTPTLEEEQALRAAGATNTRALLELDPQTVWQHGKTAPDYILFPDPPMLSMLPLLEIRARLLDADRAALVGAANYILVVRLGTDAYPTSQDEMTDTRAGMQNIARLPIVVGDHRLQVDIVAPPTDMTLNAEKHDVADMAIYCMLMGIPPRYAVRYMDPEIMAGMVTARLTAQRKMLANAANKFVAAEIAKRSPGSLKNGKLVFRPRQIQLYNLQFMLSAVLAARQRNEISRESYLDALGFDQAVEADRREDEANNYDEIFQTQDPFSAPADNNAGLPKGSMNDPAQQGPKGVTGGRPRGAQDSSRTRSKSNE